MNSENNKYIKYKKKYIKLKSNNILNLEGSGMKSAKKSMINLYNLYGGVKDTNRENLSQILIERAEASSKTESLIADGTFVLSTVGAAVVTGIAATGVGIPLAAGIAGVLIVIKNITLLLGDMWKLKRIMPDVINILFHNLLLFNYMKKTEEIIAVHTINTINTINTIKKVISTEESSNTSEKKTIENNQIESRIFSKINELLTYLLKSLDTKILIKLQATEIAQKITSLNSIIEEEIKLRNKKAYFLRKIGNKLSQYMDSQRIIIHIIGELSIISGFFNILKSKFDILLIIIQYKFKDKWETILNEVTKSEDYLAFMNKDDNTGIVNSIIDKSKDDVPYELQKIEEGTNEASDNLSLPTNQS